jgi:protein-S-isoprenylcysteine O-methyltransferase Ste14
MPMSNEKRITPPQVLYSLLLVFIILHFFQPILQIIQFPYSLSGIILIIIGLVINGQGSMLLSRNKTTFKPHENPSLLIVKGPFRYSRNPIYLGGLILVLGIVVLLGSLIVFVLPVLVFLIMEFHFIPVEEEKMEEVFGKKYLDYKTRVRRWI